MVNINVRFQEEFLDEMSDITSQFRDDPAFECREPTRGALLRLFAIRGYRAWKTGQGRTK